VRLGPLSALDDGHVRLVLALARGGREIVQPFDLLSAQLDHPVVGDLSLNYTGLEVAADPGLTIYVYMAEPGSKSAESLNLLASWAATLDPHGPVQALDVGT
jgi:hypothetical protein